MKFKSNFVNVIGCGFAGCECALSLADKGVHVHVFDDRNLRLTNYEEKGVEFLKKKEFAKDLLHEEIVFLNSKLFEIENEFLEKGIKLSPLQILEKAREKVKNHPNIQFFEMTVKELNFEEINVVATGPKTDTMLFDWLINMFGARKCFDCFPVFPVVSQIDKSKFIERDGNLFLPLSYQEYIDLVNLIVLKLNFEILINKQKPEIGTIEYLVLKDKDGLKNAWMTPIYIDNCEKPYAVLKLEKCENGYAVSGFASKLSVEGQIAILHSIKGLEKCILLQKGEASQNCYINAPYMINEFCQSVKNENLFFAGNIAGVFGKTESVANGLYVANNIFSKLQGKRFVSLPDKTCLGQMMQKIIKTNNFNYSKFEPIYADYDIIDLQKKLKTQTEISNFLKFRSKMLLENYKEELKNGKLI